MRLAILVTPKFVKAAAVATLVVVVGWQVPAAAHTSLVSSVPADGEIVERAPRSVSLHFAAPADPESLRLELYTSAGLRLDVLDPTTAGGAAVDVEAELPDLEPGPYVLRWVSVGADGHRANGDVVFGVGAVGIADLRSLGTAHGVDLFAISSGGLRWLLNLAVAFVAGGVLASAWGRRNPEHRWLVAPLANRAVSWGLGACATVLAARAALILYARADATAGGGLSGAVDTPLVTGLAVAVASVGGVLVRGWVAQRVGGSSVALEAATAMLLTSMVLASVNLGHAGASDAGAWALAIAAVHALAAAAWVGPLLIGGLALRGVRSRPYRWSILAAAGRAFAPVAAGSVVALALTGPALVLVDGSWSELSDSFRWMLALKVGLVVAVALPLGLAHDRSLGLTAARRERRRSAVPARVDARPRRTALTLVSESIVLVVVLVAGSTLATSNPTRGAETGAALLGSVTDAGRCAPLEAGRLSCYRRYLAGVLETDGPDSAAAELDRLATQLPEVSLQCHQLAHDLGNDAVLALGGVSQALAEAPPTCSSGFYHGVVELAVSNLSADPTGAELSSTCRSLAEDVRFGLPHFNCVHGLGHGAMLLTDHLIEPALALCERLVDQWERSSCLGGVFMERIISIQAAPERDDSGGDLRYPCSVVADSQVDECYFLQSSYVLWKLDFDYAEAFTLCDGAPALAVDSCYRSMGRDIGAKEQHDPARVAAACGLGADSRFAVCVEAAALDGALIELDPVVGERLCDVLPSTSRDPCRSVIHAAVGGDGRSAAPTP